MRTAILTVLFALTGEELNKKQKAVLWAMGATIAITVLLFGGPYED